jgi:hypothetical protein
MIHASVGWPPGAAAYSQIVLLQDQRALKEFAKVADKYRHGMATCTVVTGGLMCQAVVAGQKFSYKAK